MTRSALSWRLPPFRPTPLVIAGWLQFARSRADGRRLWAIEGTGSYGRGCDHVPAGARRAEVVEDRSSRPAGPSQWSQKSDRLDATRAAREALSRRHLTQPRRARGSGGATRAATNTRERCQQLQPSHLQSQVAGGHGSGTATPSTRRVGDECADGTLFASSYPPDARGWNTEPL